MKLGYCEQHCFATVNTYIVDFSNTVVKEFHKLKHYRYHLQKRQNDFQMNRFRDPHYVQSCIIIARRTLVKLLYRMNWLDSVNHDVILYEVINRYFEDYEVQNRALDLKGMDLAQIEEDIHLKQFIFANSTNNLGIKICNYIFPRIPNSLNWNLSKTSVRLQQIMKDLTYIYHLNVLNHHRQQLLRSQE